jgi:hypothetical protein
VQFDEGVEFDEPMKGSSDAAVSEGSGGAKDASEQRGLARRET